VKTADWDAVTFDYWGTLVDVDRSGIEAMRHVCALLRLESMDPRALYRAWDEATVRRYRSDTWRPYRDWAALGLQDVLEPHGIALGGEWAELANTLVARMTAEAQPHPEAPAVIRTLRERVPLMPITNMDDAYFQLNPFHHEFDRYLTAQQAGAFKPSARIFERAIELLQVPPGRILHVSMSPFADLEGAMPVGMKVAWINRAGETLGPYTPRPLYEFPDLRGVELLFT